MRAGLFLANAFSLEMAGEGPHAGKRAQQRTAFDSLAAPRRHEGANIGVLQIECRRAGRLLGVDGGGHVRQHRLERAPRIPHRVQEDCGNAGPVAYRPPRPVRSFNVQSNGRKRS